MKTKWFWILTLAAAALAVLSCCVGKYPISPAQLWQILTGAGEESSAAGVFWQIRLPRVVLTMCSGCLLYTSFQVFVLYYSLLPKTLPQPLLDGAKAMNLIRDHAKEWDVDPHKVAVCGFSAGGHLAAMLSTLWREPVIEEAGLSCEKTRPDAAILGYAVVMAGEDETKPGRLAEKLGDINDPLVRKAAFLTKQVSEHNPVSYTHLDVYKRQGAGGRQTQNYAVLS